MTTNKEYTSQSLYQPGKIKKSIFRVAEIEIYKTSDLHTTKLSLATTTSDTTMPDSTPSIRTQPVSSQPTSTKPPSTKSASTKPTTSANSSSYNGEEIVVVKEGEKEKSFATTKQVSSPEEKHCYAYSRY